MIKYGLKAATKDIDVLLSTQKETAKLIQALLKSGYRIIQTDRLGAEYQEMLATQILENEDARLWLGCSGRWLGGSDDGMGGEGVTPERLCISSLAMLYSSPCLLINPKAYDVAKECPGRDLKFSFNAHFDDAFRPLLPFFSKLHMFFRQTYYLRANISMIFKSF